MPEHPYVTDRERELVEKYGDLLNNTGGNDPLDLLNDFNKPQPNNLMAVNVVRFVLAMAVHSQIVLLGTLEREGRL